MESIGFLVLFCFAALVVVWLANALVGLLSGEHPRDTGRLWLDMVLRIFALKEFGLIGRILSGTARSGWPLRVLYSLGAVGVLAYCLHGCRQ